MCKLNFAPVETPQVQDAKVRTQGAKVISNNMQLQALTLTQISFIEQLIYTHLMHHVIINHVRNIYKDVILSPPLSKFVNNVRLHCGRFPLHCPLDWQLLLSDPCSV